MAVQDTNPELPTETETPVSDDSPDIVATPIGPTKQGSQYDLYHLLVKEGSIRQDKLENTLDLSVEQGLDIVDTLLQQNVITEEHLLEILADFLDIPFELIDNATVDIRTAQLIPENFAREHSVLPLFALGSQLTTAVSNPFDLHILEEVERITSYRVTPVLSPKKNIENLINHTFSFQDQEIHEDTPMSSLFEMGMKLVEDKQASGNDDEIYDLAQEAPIAKLVDTIIKQAIASNASDIHIEPEESVVKVRFRVDGMMKDIMTPPKKLDTAIVSRIKILSNLDITETRKPQDGRITFSTKNRDIDFRVSTVRTISGEKVVMRVLDKTGAFVSIDKIGLSEKDYTRLDNLIHSSSGIIIVCGPTGSGKTSTLYSALSVINTPEKNIITIEDPVEYNLDGINQIPVNHRIGLDFVTGLSAIVRQDPDVIMLGEVRDIETATISIQAALTGHLVFTTLHTRNAPGSITRLLDMGVQPFLLNSSVIGVVGQRLVRTLCTNCRRVAKSDTIMGFKQQELYAQMEDKFGKGVSVYMGEGCKLCDGTGYKGRTGIFEIMKMTEEIGSLVAQKASTEAIQKAAIKGGMTTMQMDVLNKVKEGITSLDEVARVIDL